MAALIRTDRNGTKYYEGLVTCDRCGGLGGHEKWAYTGWTCYKCGGSGKIQGRWKEYTPEYEAKLLARREAKRKKWEEEHKEEIEERKRLEEERSRAEEEEKKAESERKARSNYLGEIGEKVELKAVLESTIRYTARAFVGWGEETKYIYKFRAGDNLLTWFTTSSKLYNTEEGTQVTVTGTVKKHEEYKEEKQTVLTRVKVVA